MALLGMVQDITRELGIPKPTLAINSGDLQVQQIVSLANREGRMLAKRHQWEKMIKIASFTMLLAELQGAMTTVAGSDFDYMIAETIWDDSDQEQIAGPMSPRQWQLLEASVVTGPVPVFNIYGGNLYLKPAPSSANTLKFAYYSKNWCQSSGGTGQSAWTADTDTGLLDEDLMSLGIKWRWLKAKGLDYSEEFREYELQVSMATSRDGSTRVLYTDKPTESPAPKVGVPEGSWGL
jgi:hypothetical protein